MLFKWMNAQEVTEVGTALADSFVLPTASQQTPHKQTGQEALAKELQKLLQRVDREARHLKLNVFKRAQLANSFKWRLLEKGVEREIVEELTQALVVRLTANPVSSAPPAKPIPGSPNRRASGNAEALVAEANGHMARDEYAEAITCYQELLSLDPRHAVARNNLGAALIKLGRYKEAEEQFRRAIGIKPGYPDAHSNLGTVLTWMGRYAESETSLRRALKLKPSSLDALISLGMTLFALRRLRDAKDCYERALRVAPRKVQALVGLGQIAAHEGRLAEAETLFKRALEIEPKAATAWAGVVGLRKMTPADATWLKGAEEVAGGGLAPVEESTIRYAIGKYCDDVGDFRRAFRSYQRANELAKMRAEPYDREAHHRFVDELMNVCTRETLAGARAGASDSVLPVFVVGMMRSGTSLVEQIIASHPAAKGAGELEFWSTAMHKHEAAVRNELLGEPLRRKLAAAYLKVLAPHAANVLRVVDKAPVNAEYLGIIHSVFPRARMIYLQRDPVDSCLSSYFQEFSPAVNFATDLSDLAHYYREHQRLVAHWRNTLPPGTLLDVPYADLVADQEGWTRKIIDFVGLEWDARCLEFHKTDRAVMTASFWQVRQKIFRGSVGRWRNYETFIAPLLELRNLDS